MAATEFSKKKSFFFYQQIGLNFKEEANKSATFGT